MGYKINEKLTSKGYKDKSIRKKPQFPYVWLSNIKQTHTYKYLDQLIPQLFLKYLAQRQKKFISQMLTAPRGKAVDVECKNRQLVLLDCDRLFSDNLGGSSEVNKLRYKVMRMLRNYDHSIERHPNSLFWQQSDWSEGPLFDLNFGDEARLFLNDDNQIDSEDQRRRMRHRAMQAQHQAMEEFSLQRRRQERLRILQQFDNRRLIIQRLNIERNIRRQRDRNRNNQNIFARTNRPNYWRDPDLQDARMFRDATYERDYTIEDQIFDVLTLGQGNLRNQRITRNQPRVPVLNQFLRGRRTGTYDQQGVNNQNNQNNDRFQPRQNRLANQRQLDDSSSSSGQNQEQRNE